MNYILYFVIPMVVSAILIFPTKQLGFKYGIYALENKRTVHHGKIVRIGGLAIYLSFIIISLILVEDTQMFRGLLIGATIVFIEGLIDDIFDVKPIVKIIAQFLAASAAIFLGNIVLLNIHLFFGINIEIKLFGYIVTYLWIIGVTNAVNLIDGLDGLAGGFSIIVLFTISLLSSFIGVTYLAPICLILAGATAGFLIFNFHPASIFMGDCGSQLLGYSIASISLFGFRKATFITLAIPIMLLFIPIADTLLAIIRRKLKGQKITAPDKGHLHHMLMDNMRLGQVGAVTVIYVVTALFGFDSYLFFVNPTAGWILFIVLVLLFDLFIEYTGMVSVKYRPLLSLLDKIRFTESK